MSESKHTPGPWVVHAGKMHGFDCYVANPNGDAECGTWLVAGVRWTENARLIAAAPELLAALQAHVDAHQPPTSAKRRHAAYLAAQAAIAKATGQ
jgi:hypothetical protein